MAILDHSLANSAIVLPSSAEGGEVKILIADDHPLYREAVSLQVRRLYPDAGIDEVASLQELHALAAGSPAPYQLMLVDFHMPGMSIEALAALIAGFPKVPLAVISGMARAADIRAAVQVGARAYIPKTSTPEHFAQVLQMLLAGGTSIPADVFLEQGGDSGWELSTREREVLKGVALGQSNKEIGRELGLAEVTIKLHLRNLFRKMGARSRAEAAVMAVKAGLE
jgi:two-component system, NarL family, nitrate/nitrite response regulator NarL